ncbi:hypothetical protein RCK87_25705, partial [Salmonella enterica subsp. enterica serovar 1,4,[5],12:i:-]
VQDDGTDSDQNFVADCAAVHHSAMPDHAVLSDDAREAWVGVHDDPVLNVAAASDFDPFVVSA